MISDSPLVQVKKQDESAFAAVVLFYVMNYTVSLVSCHYFEFLLFCFTFFPLIYTLLFLSWLIRSSIALLSSRLRQQRQELHLRP